eukprot:CAMPEP_0172487304 /NCGR_PEP_ID=MMETSP1066-20121228/16333_1 /TAXON_ID=671091 /ORGANISM="Coscinodiscus wailesii, Strain CCMP2513" /LENGTH=479 /DNA_ID=CAMNT_0013253837 /DNA_START=365 /DNA_END=1804 /DNA_ORIENTATION=+
MGNRTADSMTPGMIEERKKFISDRVRTKKVIENVESAALISRRPPQFSDDVEGPGVGGGGGMDEEVATAHESSALLDTAATASEDVTVSLDTAVASPEGKEALAQVEVAPTLSSVDESRRGLVKETSGSITAAAEKSPFQQLSYFMKKDISCYICLCEYEVGDEVSWSRNPQCEHAFHKECITRWLLDRDDCPCCRNKFILESDEDCSGSGGSSAVEVAGGSCFVCMTNIWNCIVNVFTKIVNGILMLASCLISMVVGVILCIVVPIVTCICFIPCMICGFCDLGAPLDDDDDDTFDDLTPDMIESRRRFIFENVVTKTVAEADRGNRIIPDRAALRFSSSPPQQQDTDAIGRTGNDQNSLLYQHDNATEANQSNSLLAASSTEDNTRPSPTAGRRMESQHSSRFKQLQYFIKKDVSCGICLQEYQVDEEVCWSRNPECQHCYHKECIAKWLIKHDTCPICRKEYLVDDLTLSETENIV